MASATAARSGIVQVVQKTAVWAEETHDKRCYVTGGEEEGVGSDGQGHSLARLSRNNGFSNRMKGPEAM